ncbi:hypothetical protein DSO57_1028980 [Entomophthora muscae]|uniref:Uncharacterized protein n=1 Tax=Entomophthora muscae TaxID=34485 RepID=A0ACC2SEB8_9FUNG|nr:hypothetical protein DSO57_1028980 [Entomophthora muscae]
MKFFGIIACATSLVLGLPLLERRTFHCHGCNQGQSSSSLMESTSNNNNNNNNNNIVIPMFGGGGGGGSSSSSAAAAGGGGGGYYPPPNYGGGGGGGGAPGGVQIVNQFESSPVQNGYSSANNMAGAGASQGQAQGMGGLFGGGGFPPLPPFFMDPPGFGPMGPLPWGRQWTSSLPGQHMDINTTNKQLKLQVHKIHCTNLKILESFLANYLTLGLNS